MVNEYAPMEIADCLWDCKRMMNLSTNQALAVQDTDSAMQRTHDAVVAVLVTGCAYSIHVAGAIVGMAVENGEPIRYCANYWDNASVEERRELADRYGTGKKCGVCFSREHTGHPHFQ